MIYIHTKFASVCYVHQRLYFPSYFTGSLAFKLFIISPYLLMHCLSMQDQSSKADVHLADAEGVFRTVKVCCYN